MAPNQLVGVTRSWTHRVHKFTDGSMGTKSVPISSLKGYINSQLEYTFFKMNISFIIKDGP